jgi:hypothetical protein
LKAKDKGERFNAEVRNGERLLESTVENGIAGGVDEFREDHGVFVGERASVAREKNAPMATAARTRMPAKGDLNCGQEE